MAIVPLLRRGSTRTRFGATNSSQSTSASTSNQATSGSGTAKPRDATVPTSNTIPTPHVPGRPGRPRKVGSTSAQAQDEQDRPKRSRGRPPKLRDETEEVESPSDVDEPQSPSESTEAINESMDVDMEVDQPESGSTSHTQEERPDRKETTLVAVELDESSSRGRGRVMSQSRDSSQDRGMSKSRGDSDSRSRSRNSDGHSRTMSGSRSESPTRKQGRTESSHVSEERDGDDGSSASDGDDADADSDDDRRGTGASKEKRSRTERVPTKRRLRSSKRIPNVVAHLTADADGLDMDHLLSDFTEEQQQLKANTSAAVALTRLFRQGIQDSESLHPDMVDAQDYELIRHTFGEIEDLNLNLTGTMSTPDESNSEDDELTRDLKRDHRAAKRNLYEVSAEYKVAKNSMRIQMTAALDVEETQIRAGTHPGLLAELRAIEDRRNARIDIARAQKGYAERMWEQNYQAVRKAAFDQYKAGLIDTRRVMIDLVQSRMDRIKQEKEESNRVAEKANIKTKALAEALFYRNTVIANHANPANDSCGESCSSYDSYSSSGSECSDCEICIPSKQSRVSRLTAPQGLSRKEVAADLAFLFPDETLSRPAASRDTFSPMGQVVSQQQHMIDQMNEERRKRRRVMDREMQNKTAYKKHAGQSADIRMTSGSPTHDMDIDQEADDMFDQQLARSRHGKGYNSRADSPAQAQGRRYRSIPDAPPTRPTKDHQPRFIPGFGPDGPEQAPPKDDPSSPYSSRYPLTDRYGRPWDASRLGIPDKLTDPRQLRPPPPLSVGGRESSRPFGSSRHYDASPKERNGRLADPLQDARQQLMHPRSRHHDDSYRSRYEHDPAIAYGPHHTQSLRYPSDPAAYHPPDPRAYPYDDPRSIVPPRKRPPMLPPPPQSEASVYPPYVRAPRGRPPKNPRVSSFVDPAVVVSKSSPYAHDPEYNRASFPSSPQEGPAGARYHNGTRAYPPGGYFPGFRAREPYPIDRSPTVPHAGGRASPQERGVSTTSPLLAGSRSHPLSPLNAVSRPAYPPGSYTGHMSPHHLSPDLRRGGSLYPPPGPMHSSGGYGGPHPPPPTKGRRSPVVIDLSSEPNSPVLEPIQAPSPKPKDAGKGPPQDAGSPRVTASK
ncbi:hypothetical protein KI688_003952 [Linnemannia hyalina]|uniref:Uncharacterized protein n=1 Tax=Linnemannia hyalina TaxID=64524 RepID=A0A9P7XM45_9FUNG|nr:hypothetical protein KI688_003952 [Linnemannia hyalina]